MVPARFVVFVFAAPLVFRAPSGPAAREARRPHFVRRRASKPARALRSLRRPPHRRCLWFWCVWPGPAAAHGRRSRAPPPTGDLSFVVHRASLVRLFEPYLACLCLALKPTAPLLALPCSGMKPPSPLRAVKGHFWAKSNLQRCWRFQSGVQRGVQRCWRFQRCPVIVSCARKSSPCISRSCRGARKSSPCKLKAGEKRCFLVCWANFFAEVLWDGLRWASIFAEEPLRSLIVNMSMCVRSPCGGRSSAGEQFCMQFPSRYFK